jgi:hypothetical protein
MRRFLILVAMGFVLASPIYSYYFSIFGSESFGDIRYQIGSADSEKGSYAPRTGIGVLVNSPVMFGVEAEAGYEKFNSATADVFGESIGISNVFGNAIYYFPYQPRVKWYLKAGGNYSFWDISNRFSSSSPSGLGFQGAIGLFVEDKFRFELGLKRTKAYASSFAQVVENGATVFKDFWIDSTGIYLSVAYSFVRK